MIIIGTQIETNDYSKEIQLNFYRLPYILQMMANDEEGIK